MTSSPRKDIPSIGSIAGQAPPAALERVREEVQVLLGHRGNELDQAATWRQLVERGFAQRQVVPGGGGPFVPVPSPGGASENEDPDLTPPPTPTGLAVVAGFSSLIVEWDPPIYTQGHGHGQTNVYGAQWPLDDPTPPTFSEAVPLGAAPGAMTVTAIPSNPATRWKIWIKWQSRDGVESLPAGGTNGVEATTGADVDTVLEALTGEITASQLASSLASPIAQIPIIQANLAALIEAPDYDSGTTYNPGDVVKSGGSLYQCIATTTGNAPPNATYWTLIGDFDSLAGAVAAHTIQLADHESRITSAEGDITAEIAARTLLAATVGSNTAAIATETSARVSGDAANAASITALTATVGTNTAAIATEASVRASADGALQAQYTVKIDTNGYVSGFGLASTLNNAAPFSQFLVRADSFSVASPSGPGLTPIVPFTVRTTPTTINGVPVPAGVYMDAAYILRGSITAAQIGNAVIDDAKVANLSAAKLTVGDGTVGGNLKSTVYTAGSAGWIVRPDGYAEFQNVIARGTVFANAGAIGGNTINASGVQSPGYTAGSAGWRIDSSGAAEFSGATVRGTIVATAGTIGGNTINASAVQSPGFVAGSAGWRLQSTGAAEFQNVVARGDIQATSLNAATGTFSGTLTAAAVNAVNTINLAGEAVTIPRGTELDSDFNYGALGSWVTVLSVTMNPLGGSIIATAIGKIVVNAYGGGSSVDLDVRLLINGVQKMTDGISTTGATGQREGFALQGITQSLTGNITVELQARRAGVTSAGTPRIAAGTSLIVIGARR